MRLIDAGAMKEWLDKYTSGQLMENKHVFQALDEQPTVELEQAKKPIFKERLTWSNIYQCPTCGQDFSGQKLSKYCFHCGQKYDWSDVE